MPNVATAVTKPPWRQRAFGWIKVMGVDVVNSMVIYTFASVSHPLGRICFGMWRYRR